MKTLSFIVLFFALLGLSACGNRILVGKDIPTKILYIKDKKNVSKDEVATLQMWKKPDFSEGVGFKGGKDRYRCESTTRALHPTIFELNGKYYVIRSVIPYSKTSAVIIEDMNTCEELRLYEGDFDFSSDEKYLATCIQEKGKEVEILSLEDDLKKIADIKLPCKYAKISQNNKWLSVQTKKYIYIYDFQTRELVFQSTYSRDPFYHRWVSYKGTYALIYPDHREIKEKYYDFRTWNPNFIALDTQELVFLGDRLERLILKRKAYSDIKKLDMDKKEIVYLEHWDPKNKKFTYSISKFELEDTNK